MNAFINDYHSKVHYVGIEPQEIPFNQLKKTMKDLKISILYKVVLEKKEKVIFITLMKNIMNIAREIRFIFQMVQIHY